MTSLLSGLALGLILAITAVVAAVWVEKRRLSTVQALAAVVLGMLARMFVLAIWAAVGFAALHHEPIPFLSGLAGPWLVGQVIEIVLILRTSAGPAAGKDAPG